uniref:Type II toxin-antitoxin system mRNA interferase toxin, RelE/StbE family n=1 Tax=Archaeoglobus fulgidus TaxID=2234 RepID=A0A7C3RED8_ARCFL
MSYRAEFSDEFLKIARRLKNKDPELFSRLKTKVEEILKNPEHYKPLRGKLKGLRRAHVGSFVIIFKIEGECVKFVTFKHHDRVYE